MWRHEHLEANVGYLQTHLLCQVAEAFGVSETDEAMFGALANVETVPVTVPPIVPQGQHFLV